MVNKEDLPYRPNVGIMIRNRDGDIFVAQRKDHYSDAWQMPQGGIDPGEDPRTAALREMEEETGIPAARVTVVAETDDWITYDLPDDLLPNLWGGKYRGQKQKWFLVSFLGEDAEVNIHTTHAEFSAWKWVPPDQVVDAIVPFKRDVYTHVLRAFKEYL